MIFHLISWTRPSRTIWGKEFQEKSVRHVSLNRQLTLCLAHVDPHTISHSSKHLSPGNWQATVTCFNCARKLALKGDWILPEIPGKEHHWPTPPINPTYDYPMVCRVASD